MKIKKGDRVRVLAGKDRGKEGDVMRALPKANKVIVEGVNVAKKHQSATRATMQGGIIDKDMPLAGLQRGHHLPGLRPDARRLLDRDGRRPRAPRSASAASAGADL